jgi:hypothetical protein
MFVARFAADRALRWARTAGAVDEFSFGESATALAAGPDDSLVVAGYLTGPTTFGAGEPAETTLGSGTSIDMFLARYDLDGGLAWARGVEGTDSLDWIVPETLAARGDELVVWGELAEHATFGPDEPGETSIASHGNFDVFLARFGHDGAFRAVRAGGGIDPDYAYDAVFGPDRGLLVGGLRATATLALWPVWAPTFTSTGLSDVFVAAVPNP